MELRVKWTRIIVVCVISGEGGIEISFSSFFFFFFLFFVSSTFLERLVWTMRAMVATGCVRGVGDDGGRVICDIVIDEMRSDCIFHGSGNGSRSKARETRAFHGHVCLPKRISWRARASLPVNLTCSVCEISIATRAHNLKIRGWLIKGRIRVFSRRMFKGIKRVFRGNIRLELCYRETRKVYRLCLISTKFEADDLMRLNWALLSLRLMSFASA